MIMMQCFEFNKLNKVQSQCIHYSHDDFIEPSDNELIRHHQTVEKQAQAILANDSTERPSSSTNQIQENVFMANNIIQIKCEIN